MFRGKNESKIFILGIFGIVVDRIFFYLLGGGVEIVEMAGGGKIRLTRFFLSSIFLNFFYK